jgi:hypothetical protein
VPRGNEPNDSVRAVPLEIALARRRELLRLGHREESTRCGRERHNREPPGWGVVRHALRYGDGMWRTCGAVVLFGANACAAPDATPLIASSPPSASSSPQPAATALAHDASDTADLDAPSSVLPIDAAALADASVESAVPVCARYVGSTAHLVRGRVRSAGTLEERQGGKNYGFDFAVIDILEIISGNLDGVSPPYRKSFYALTVASFSDDRGNHGWGGLGIAEHFVHRVGEELIFLVTLPGDHGGIDGGVIPARFAREYGHRRAQVSAFCPLEARDALVAWKESARSHPPAADGGHREKPVDAVFADSGH